MLTGYQIDIEEATQVNFTHTTYAQSKDLDNEQQVNMIALPSLVTDLSDSSHTT